MSSTPPRATPAPAATPTPRESLRRLMAGVAADALDYGDLQFLLEAQFDAALRHRHAELGALAERIGMLCDTLEQRRRQRVATVAHLLGPAAGMRDVFALLKGNARETLEMGWHALEPRIVECQRIGKRNSDLLVDQFSLMQRVLHGEEQLYAPG